MKSLTDIKQSKNLMEILPPESADFIMYYNKEDRSYVITDYPDDAMSGEDDIPCWSIAALLDILPFPQLSKDKLGSGKEGWMVSVYPDNCRYDSCWHENPIDACVEMIIKLKDMNLL